MSLQLFRYTCPKRRSDIYLQSLGDNCLSSLKSTDSAQILHIVADCSFKLFRDVFFQWSSYIPRVLTVFCYYLLLFVFITFKKRKTLVNGLDLSNNLFKLQKNLCCHIHALLKYYFGWFWWVSNCSCYTFG